MFSLSLITFSLLSRNSIIWPTIFLMVSSKSIFSLFWFSFLYINYQPIKHLLNSFNLVQMHIYNNLLNNTFNLQILPFNAVFTSLRNLFTYCRSSCMHSTSADINTLFASFIQPNYSVCTIIKYVDHRNTAFTCWHFFLTY